MTNAQNMVTQAANVIRRLDISTAWGKVTSGWLVNSSRGRGQKGWGQIGGSAGDRE